MHGFGFFHLVSGDTWQRAVFPQSLVFRPHSQHSARNLLFSPLCCSITWALRFFLLFQREFLLNTVSPSGLSGNWIRCWICHKRALTISEEYWIDQLNESFIDCHLQLVWHTEAPEFLIRKGRVRIQEVDMQVFAKENRCIFCMLFFPFQSLEVFLCFFSSLKKIC